MCDVRASCAVRCGALPTWCPIIQFNPAATPPLRASTSTSKGPRRRRRRRRKKTFSQIVATALLCHTDESFSFLISFFSNLHIQYFVAQTKRQASQPAQRALTRAPDARTRWEIVADAPPSSFLLLLLLLHPPASGFVLMLLPSPERAVKKTPRTGVRHYMPTQHHQRRDAPQRAAPIAAYVQASRQAGRQVCVRWLYVRTLTDGLTALRQDGNAFIWL
ncbi:hypothetical protein IWX90DRAFT_133575 [Phyllosticta citrichinensis]|uniref:Uncharacterized protein n=1 Tax=Phyllosticta citrichinensis TaxID=1130410 RepID=A0ABR1Y5E7_9PEZI